MQPHEQRVVTERDELLEKITKLGAFLAGENVANLQFEDRKLLEIQKMNMDAYLETLDARIARFNKR